MYNCTFCSRAVHIIAEKKCHICLQKFCKEHCSYSFENKVFTCILCDAIMKSTKENPEGKEKQITIKIKYKFK